jgi:hypothetical protein
MSTLYDRLEDDIRKGLANNTETYPAGTASVLKALKTNYSWLNLTIGQVHSLVMFSDIPWGKITDQTFKFGENIIKDEE